MIYSLIFLAAVNSALGAIAEDEVTSLPGSTFTPKFKHYSGYLQSNGKMLHYWLV